MVSSELIFGTLLSGMAGLYISHAIMYHKLGKMIERTANNTDDIQYNTELIHSHVVMEGNPHPKYHPGCPLCEQLKKKRGHD